ncbi:unnamed protein product [Vitrella brassicaformis CCMP3155]|uniref:RING-type domain-containing protein n=2 Tax=Vitrella brassicaformis TaxID=1169539 RepID=A0A0G4ESV4_VITBC|nr:unnamed protein product [Vitrella brassicaformis CCMP3155]|eukprot:CEM00791.1 unnamed protein product [Vitrella brassicaformis CCMP3155]
MWRILPVTFLLFAALCCCTSGTFSQGLVNPANASLSTPLVKAAFQGEVWPFLFRLASFSTNLSDTQLQAALFAAIHGQDPMSTVPLLLPHVANLDARDEEGNSVLHHAVNASNPRLTELLLQATPARKGGKRVDINGRNHMNANALHMALSGCNDAIGSSCLDKIQTLIDHGIDIEATGPDFGMQMLHPPLPFGTRFRHSVIDGRLRVSNVTALSQAAMPVPCVPCFERLLHNGADVHSRSSLGTPVVLAATFDCRAAKPFWPCRNCTRGQAEIVKMALRRGADVNAAGEYGTALHWAAYNGCVRVAKTLLTNGANPTLPISGSDNTKPLDIAIEAGHKKLEALLTAAETAHIDTMKSQVYDLLLSLAVAVFCAVGVWQWILRDTRLFHQCRRRASALLGLILRLLCQGLGVVIGAIWSAFFLAGTAITSLCLWAGSVISSLTTRAAQPRHVDTDLAQQQQDSASAHGKRAKKRHHRRSVSTRAAGGGEGVAHGQGAEGHDNPVSVCMGGGDGGVGVATTGDDGISEHEYVNLLQQYQAMAAEREAALQDALNKERQSAETKGRKMGAALERLKAENENLKHMLLSEQTTIAALKETKNNLEIDKERAAMTVEDLTEKLSKCEDSLANLQHEKHETTKRMQRLEKEQNGTNTGFVNASAISSYDDRLRTAVDEQAVRRLQADINSSLQDVVAALDHLHTTGRRCQARLVDLEDQRKCVVCTERSPCVVFHPCSHMCMCAGCWSRSRQRHRQPTCPMCRADVVSHTQINA